MADLELKDGKELHIEDRVDPNFNLQNLSTEDAEFLNSLTDEQKRKAVRKVDVRLIPLLTLLALFSYIDRANIGNAKIEGLDTDLHLDGVKYNIALCLFFFPYIIFEIPSNWVLSSKIMKPSYYIGAMIIAWGVVMSFSGLIQNFGSLVATRMLLGLFEAGFFPGAVYLISMWYLPNESQFRIAIFYCASAAAGAFSGLLAFAIAKMDGVGGYSGWRWIFIIEGIASVAAGAVTVFCLPNSPAESGSFLTPEEIRYLQIRQLAVPGRQRHGEYEKPTRKQSLMVLRSVLKDWQIYVYALIYISSVGPNYALKFTMPQIIKNMDYQSSMAQVLTIPPYTVGVITTIVSAWLADRYTWRMPFVVFSECCMIVSHAILYSYGPTVKDHIPECYFALCLACVAFYPIPPAVNAWVISNTAPSSKRAMAIAYFVGLGNVGGIFGSFIYRDSEAPRYPSGYGTAFSLASAGLLAAVGLDYLYYRINKSRDTVDEDEVRRTYTAEELDKMGDRSPLFRYSY